MTECTMKIKPRLRWVLLPTGVEEE